MRLVLRRIDQQNAPGGSVCTHRAYKRQAHQAHFEHICKFFRQIRCSIAAPPGGRVDTRERRLCRIVCPIPRRRDSLCRPCRNSCRTARSPGQAEKTRRQAARQSARKRREHPALCRAYTAAARSLRRKGSRIARPERLAQHIRKRCAEHQPRKIRHDDRLLACARIYSSTRRSSAFARRRSGS